ncbi:MAG: VWA domain-containing protein [Nibricoccus sp.]
MAIPLTKLLALADLNLRFADPLWLLALLIIPTVIWLRGRRRVPVLVVPFAASWHRKSISAISRWPEILAITGLSFVIVALARPQQVRDKREVRSQGYDLILAIDISSSMLTEDYEKNGTPMNRLQAIKPVIQAFIDQRANDRIGMVVFAGRAYTLAPLTFDHSWLAQQTERLQVGMIEDGTAIGDGLGVALTRLEQASREEGGRRKGAFVILLTDGANNKGSLSPQQAADIAKSRGVPVYTIGAGRDGVGRMPILNNGRKVGYRPVASDLDEITLHDIADTTGGHFFRADDLRTVESAFKNIDRTQKIEFQAKTYLLTNELFAWVAVPGLFFLIAAIFVNRRGSRNRLPKPKASPISAERSAVAR